MVGEEKATAPGARVPGPRPPGGTQAVPVRGELGLRDSSSLQISRQLSIRLKEIFGKQKAFHWNPILLNYCQNILPSNSL